jgi:uncharacterized protein YndB with AHSA1/START domain
MMRAQKKVADDELLIVRTFDALPSLVFALWSSAEHPKRWMGPKNLTCPDASIDFRVGGAYRAMIKSVEHGESWFSGVYREIVQHKRLLFIVSWDNEEPSAAIETLVTISFEARDGSTVQTLHQAPFRDSHVGGWIEAFDKEQAYAETIAKEHPA